MNRQKIERDVRAAERLIRRDIETQLLERLIVQHQGDLAAVARAWPRPITRQGVEDKVNKRGLTGLVESARKPAGIFETTDPVELAEKIVSALHQAGTVTGAARLLGISRRWLNYRCKRLGIEAAAVVRQNGGRS